jgi:cytochrome c553
MAAFSEGVRRSADPSGTSRMILIAKNLSADDLNAAANYFSQLTYRPWIRVVETASVPKVQAFNRMLFFQPGGEMEPLGERIIETTTDMQRTDLRDPHFGFVAYVPLGSVAAGKALSSAGSTLTTPCASCHGEDLKGKGAAPPLAGRSPSYTLRQLYDIQHGLRGGLADQSMSRLLSQMTLEQMIDVSAYAASLKP